MSDDLQVQFVKFFLSVARPGGTDKAVCKNGVNVDVTVQCVLDYDQYGEVIGCRDLSHLENCGESDL